MSESLAVEQVKNKLTYESWSRLAKAAAITGFASYACRVDNLEEIEAGHAQFVMESSTHILFAVEAYWKDSRNDSLGNFVFEVGKATGNALCIWKSFSA